MLKAATSACRSRWSSTTTAATRRSRQGASSGWRRRTRSTSSCRRGARRSTSRPARPSTGSAIRTSPSPPRPTARRSWPSAGRTASGSSAPRAPSWPCAGRGARPSCSSEGKIGDKVAMVSVADQFGIELSTAARAAFKKAGFNARLRQELSARHAGHAADAERMRCAATPTPSSRSAIRPTRSTITDAGEVLSFNPKVFYTGVGTAFPLFKRTFGANAEGVMGIGGWNADSPGAQGLPQAPHRGDRRASPTAGRARSPMPACRCCSRRSSASARSIARPSIKELQTGDLRHDHRQDQARRTTSCRTSGGSASGRAASSSASRRRKHERRQRRRCARSRHGSSEPSRGCASGRDPCCSVDILLSGLVLGGMYALIAHGADAPVRRRAHHEPRLRRVPGRRRVRRLLALHRTGDEPARRARSSSCRSPSRSTGLIYQLLLMPLVQPRQEPRHAGGRQHPCDLRAAVRRAGHRARASSAASIYSYSYLSMPVDVLGTTVAAQPADRAGLRRGDRRSRSISP